MNTPCSLGVAQNPLLNWQKKTLIALAFTGRVPETTVGMSGKLFPDIPHSELCK